jgi:RNA polymerase sigma-70 factor (ECF subfamily)
MGAPNVPGTVEAFARGEADAVREMFRAHGAVVARVVARMGVAPADVEDVVQTTFLDAMRSAGQFRGDCSVRTWLASIAVNHARMLFRGRARAKRSFALVAASAETTVEPSFAHEDQQETARLRAALDRLPELQREALVLCELEELPGKEVAAMLGVPVATIWRRVHDAKVSLRRLLTEGP